MSVYTIEQLRARLTGQGFAQSTPPPAGKIWVIRDVTITNLGPEPLLHQVYVLVPGGASFALYSDVLESERSIHLELRQVVKGPECIYVSSTSLLSDFSVCGYELSEAET